ncbi:MAG: uroporphyrinogen decarboxylase family protein [Candidatus Bipolaricaulota bacterium]
MTPRERVLAAINHKEPDRVPIVIGANNTTGIRMETYKEIKEIIGVEAPDEFLYRWPELGTAEIDEKTLKRLGSDVRGVWDLEPASVLESNNNREPGSPYINSWGSGQVKTGSGDWFPGIHPLSDADSVEDLEAYKSWPDMSDPTRVDHVKDRVENITEKGDYAIMATPWLLFPLERAFAMQGMDVFLQNTVTNPDFAKALLEKIAEKCKALMDPFLAELNGKVDIVGIGDDLGTQESLLMSPETYRKILKPIHADYVEFIKERTDAKVFFHTDGDVSPLVGDFIEIGIDILNPIQTSAGGMSNLAELKGEFGDDIVFCGGIDTQKVLPGCSPDEVRTEVRRVIDTLGPGGGYMVSAVHTITEEVPAENVLAMVDAVRDFGNYPLG